MPNIIYTTGITGFIGQHLLKKLINEYDITVNFGRNKKISIYQSSLNPIYKDFNLNELEVYQADSIFHLATYYNSMPKDLSEEDLLEESNFNFPSTLCNDLKKLGLIKIISDASTDEVLGVHMIAPRAADLIMEAVVAMEYRASAEDIARICHPHPTYSEAVKEAALAATENRPLHI